MQKVFKHPKVVFPILLLSLFLFYSCDSGGSGETDDFVLCDIGEMRENFANTDCIAEELSMGCSNIECSNRGMAGIGEKEISLGGSSTCSLIDCVTMECELRAGGESLLGLVSELMIDEIGGLPIGLFTLENQQSTFGCVFIAVD